MSVISPIRRQVIVAVDPDRAFTAWTDQMGAWWPFAQHSVYGDGATVAFVDGRLIETAPDGSSCSWGTVTAWEPGERLTMTWHPGQSEDASTTVDVRFDAISDDQTLVTLTHSGWENRVDAIDARSNYRNGWPIVVDRFADGFRGVEKRPQSDGTMWLVLRHFVAPEVDGQAFASPLFQEHLAFIQRAHERGWLVAAGSLPDSPGAGMTILHVPSEDAGVAVLAAQDDDQSVVKGLFDVHVRQWNVALSK